jgi:ribosomal protein S18 acetylase RimI-like enzyme
MAIQFNSRPFRQPADLESMLALVKSRPASRILDYPGLSDLREMLAVPGQQALTCIWETGQAIFAGYALLNCEDEFAGIAFEFAQEFSSSSLGDRMIAWAEETFLRDYTGRACEITSSAHSSQIERIRLLERNGFQRETESVLHFARALDEPIAEPCLPAAFTIRPLGAGEKAAWVALHQAAFGTQNMTLEYRRAMSAMPGYDPSLDLVAAAPDGSLAAYVFGAIRADENALTGERAGHTDPVATHPQYQHLGLSKALLLTSLHLIKQCGMDTARLGTSSDNIAMQKTALSVGFRLVGESWHYTKSFQGTSGSRIGKMVAVQKVDQL